MFIITHVSSPLLSAGFLVFLLAVSFLFFGCDPPPKRNVAALCDSIKDIETLPHKDEAVADPAYNALLSAGEDAIPCLIRKITDETVMKDPRSAPKVGNVAVGDTAFFVLRRIGKIDQAGFVELLPPDVRKAYDEEGVNGYFRLIDEDNNRQKLQAAAKKWYEKRYGPRPQLSVRVVLIHLNLTTHFVQFDGGVKVDGKIAPLCGFPQILFDRARHLHIHLSRIGIAVCP